MHNYIKYRLANKGKIPRGNWIDSSFGYNNLLPKDPYVESYAQGDIPERWDKIIHAFTGLPIFKGKLLHESNDDEDYGIQHEPSLKKDPTSTWIFSPKHIMRAVGHLMAEEMSKHPHGKYTLDDMIEDQEHYPLLDEFNEHHGLSDQDPSWHKKLNYSKSTLIHPTDRNGVLFHTLPKVLPHWWNEFEKTDHPYFRQFVEDESQHQAGGRHSELPLHTMLRDAIKQYGHGHSLALDFNRVEKSPSSIYHISRAGENLPSFALTRGNDERLNIHNKLIHSLQGLPGIFENTQFIENPWRTKDIEVNESKNPITYYIPPRLASRLYGMLLTKHLSPEIPPMLHDIVHGYDSSDKELVRKFHDMHGLGPVNYESPEQLLNVMAPIHFGHELEHHPFSLHENVTPDMLHKYLSEPKEGHGPLEQILQEHYLNS